MNANELANWILDEVRHADEAEEIAAMLRQQQAEIAELKVMLGHYEDVYEGVVTHPVKELTDEEIDKLLHEEFVKFQATGLISEIEWERWLVKAILRKDGA